jgi:ferredoxin
VAGGANFRRSRLERLRYRFRHKYYGLGPHRGSFACVGCGRCLAVCPVDIDLSLILRECAP